MCVLAVNIIPIRQVMVHVPNVMLESCYGHGRIVVGIVVSVGIAVGIEVRVGGGAVNTMAGRVGVGL